MATMRSFIKNNRQELDLCIRRFLDDPKYKLNDEERRKWILNDESLYNWARSEGVKI
jgi:succinate dehydrogenase flavin-adding protein (antitoxin of CptAB toxin-antitoxin module)